MKFFKKHPAETQNPQTYLIHFKVAVKSSLLLIWIGIIGIIHAFLPGIKWMQFYTSTRIMRGFIKLVESGRHISELEIEFKNKNIHIIYDKN